MHGWGGMSGRGACMAGGMRGRGACMVGVCMSGGVCGRGSGMHGRGALGEGVRGRRVCVVGDLRGRGACVPQQILRDTVNERAVRILLECILDFHIYSPGI